MIPVSYIVSLLAHFENLWLHPDGTEACSSRLEQPFLPTANIHCAILAPVFPAFPRPRIENRGAILRVGGGGWPTPGGNKGSSILRIPPPLPSSAPPYRVDRRRLN